MKKDPQVGDSAARELVLRQISDLLPSRDAERLHRRIREDDEQFALGAEIAILLSTGIGLVAAGLAIVIKSRGLDLWLPFTVALAVAGAGLVTRAANRLSPKHRDAEATLPWHIQLMLGVAFLVGFIGAVQLLYDWSNLTTLAAAVGFFGLAWHCNSKAVLASSLGMLAAFLGVETVPNNWTIFHLVEKTGAAWTFVAIVVGLALLLGRLRDKNDFSIICLDFAVPVALVTLNLEIVEANKAQALSEALFPLFAILAATRVVLWASSKWRLVLLSLIAIGNAVFGFMSFVALFLDVAVSSSDSAGQLFFFVLFIVAISAMVLATRIVRRDSEAKGATP